MAMAATKTFSGKKLVDPEKHVKRFKLNVLSKIYRPINYLQDLVILEKR